MNVCSHVQLFLLVTVCGWFSVSAQQKDSIRRNKIIVYTIKVSGNNRTKTSIILRELTFKAGDTIPASEWGEALMRSKNNLHNTALFNFVDFDTISAGRGAVNLTINVVERWYVWPVPILQLEERNFNTWWVQDHRSLAKTDYGLFLSDNNSRGRKEILKVKLQLGYTVQWGVSYTIPYITKHQDFGLQFNFVSSQNKELAYTSIGNILTFLNTPNSLLQQQYTSALDLTYRQGLYNTHYLELNFSAAYINDTLLKITNDYLPFNANSTAFLGAKYYFKRDLRDRSAYPLEGYFFDFSLNDYGLGITIPKEHGFNITYLQSSIHKYWKMTDLLYYSAEAEAKVSQHEVQPYYVQRGLGYANDFVRGYEYYVIDGNNFGLVKNEVKFRILNVPVQQLPIRGVPQFDKAYYAFYLTAFTDWGYVGDADPNAPNNFLANTPLWGNGVGLDFVAYYDIVLRFEYSFNKLNQSGFFLHFLADM